MTRISGAIKPVVIVGAGPVGLCAALHLDRLQIPFIAYEEDAHLSTAAKAGTITPRTLEIFARVGALDEVLKEGLRFDVVDFVERRQDRVLMQLRMSELRSETAYPFALNLPQSDTERILYTRVTEGVYGEVKFGHKVVGLTQNDQGCCLAVETADGMISVETPYVLACDGGRSPIRGMLGIEPTGVTYPEKFMLVDVHVDLDEGPGRRPTYLSYVFDPEEWLIIVRQPDFWRILWPIPSEAPEPDEAEIERKLQLAVGHRPLQIIGAVSYKVHHRVAERFCRGRVFLLGDAAHLITPVGGLGLNTGIQDASNLAWKIAWVLKGRADPALLGTYEKERRPIAAYIASGIADRNRSTMMMRNPVQRAMRDVVLQLIRHSPPHRWSTAYTRSLLATSYKPASRQHPLEKAFRTVVPQAHPPARVGDRAPNGLLFGPQGESLWLHDLFGFAFVALTFDDVRNHPTIEPLPQSPYLRHYLISWFDAPADSGLRDRTFYDPGDRLRKRFGAERGTTYLVRPDDHIAAIEAAGGRPVQQIYEAVVGQPLERSSAQAYTEQEPAVAFAQSP